MKKLSAIIMCAALTVVSVVPVFAVTADEVAAAKAVSDQQFANYLAYQTGLDATAAAALAQGEANKAAGQAAAAIGQSDLAAKAAAAGESVIINCP